MIRQSARLLFTLPGHSDAINAMCVNGFTGYSASRDKTLRSFDLT
jgi:hypothetical protein